MARIPSTQQTKQQQLDPMNIATLESKLVEERDSSIQTTEQFTAENQLDTNKQAQRQTKTRPSDSLQQRPQIKQQPSQQQELQSQQELSAESKKTKRATKTSKGPAIQSTSRIAEKLANQNKSSQLFKQIKQDRQNAMNNVGSKMGRHRGKGITLTISEGKNQIKLNFQTKKQVKAFLKELVKNNRKITVTDEKGKVLHDAKTLQNKQQPQPQDQLDFAKDTTIRDGSETGKIIAAETLVSEFDGLSEGTFERTLGIKLEPDELALSSQTELNNRPNVNEQQTQELSFSEALNNMTETIEAINKPEESLTPTPEPRPDHQSGPFSG